MHQIGQNKREINIGGSRLVVSRAGWVLAVWGMLLTEVPARAQLSNGAVDAAVSTTQPAPAVPEAARKAIDAGRYTEAVAILEPLVQAGSPGFAVLVNLAGAYDALAKQAANDKTQEGRKRFAECRDKLITYYLAAAEVAQRAQDPRAESILGRVLGYDPLNAKALPILARISRDAGAATRAISYYKDYIKTTDGQTDYEAQVDLGRLLVGEGFWRQAVDVLEKAKRAAGAAAEQQLALAYLAGKQPNKAIAAANDAVNHSPQTPDPRIIRAGLALQLGGQVNPAQAVDDALKALEMARDTVAAKPTDEALWRQLDVWQKKIAQLADALKRIATGSDSGTPSVLNPAAQIKLAQLISELGKMTHWRNEYEAVVLLSRAAETEDAPAELLVALAQRQRDVGQAEQAVATAERILRKDPGSEAAKKIKETGGKPEAR